MIHEPDYQADHPCSKLTSFKVSVNLDVTMVFPVDAKDEEDAIDVVTSSQLVEWLNTGNYIKAYINDWTVEEEEITT